ncbi:hypothetical protein OG897_08625 [Streptomyces sp. NBC_00237]|uniref:hypothetical protein n=1 Tax=Streptomyces sp. NBC_00237 TaxID=2975687 RepID=UPI00225819EB|nr:hypothetical protein [Streptomyces sp. NBC_00237]MCX5201514.1 hypothetical protein [Streptomyces sp. NBC_00237]
MPTKMEARCDGFRRMLQAEVFASIVPGRSPELRYHESVYGAQAAVGWELPPLVSWAREETIYRGVRGGEVYWRSGDEWSLLYRVEEGSHALDLPWLEENQ